MRPSKLPFAALVVLVLASTGCQSYLRQFTPGTMQQGAHPHAFQTASFSYAFMNGHAVQWAARLDLVERDALPFLAAVKASPYALRVDVVPHTQGGPSQSIEYEYYDVNLALAKKGGPELVLTGAQGMSEAQQSAEDAKVGQALGLDADAVKRGHTAIYALVTMLSQLNASNDVLQRHAFKLLVMKEQVKSGQKADWFDGSRPPEETAEDVDIALRVIADHHALVAAWRSEVLGIAAMVDAYDAPPALDALKAQIADSKERVSKWRSSHHQPTMEEYGVAVRALVLPTPQAMLERLDQDGYIAAAVQVAKGISTGSISTTLEGVTKFAPKDSSIRTALEGMTAASKGDVGGVIDSVAKLAGKEAEMSALNARLSQIKGAIRDVRGGVDAVRGGVDSVKKGADAIQHGKVPQVPQAPQ